MTEKTLSSLPHYFGLPGGAAKAYFVCQKYLNNNQNAVFITAADTEDFDNGALEFAPRGAEILHFPETDTGRMHSLFTLLSPAKGPRLLSANYESLSAPLPSPEQFKKQLFVLHRGDVIRRQALLDLLEKNGYSREDYAEAPGQYGARGSVVDIFCLNRQEPLRLYFSGNRIDSVSAFDLDTQNTKEHVDQAVIIPLHFEELPSTLADYLPDYTYLLDEPAPTFDFSSLKEPEIITLLPSHGATNCNLKGNIPFGANMDLLAREIQSLKQQGLQITICCLNRGELDRLTELLADRKELAHVEFKISPLTQGFINPQDRFALITSNEILNRRYTTSSILKRFDIENAKRVRFKELQEGDYVVHQEYGIGRYLGLEVMNRTEKPTDCLMIEYRRGSRLYVPMYDFKKVQKYISAGGKRPHTVCIGG